MASLRLLLKSVLAERAGRTGKGLAPKTSEAKPATVRRLLVMKNRTCYHHCLKHLKGLGAKPVKRVRSLNAVICRFRHDADFEALAAHSMVKRVESDTKMKLHVVADSKKASTDGDSACASIKRPQFIPWGVERIGAPTVWKRTRGQGIRVAVIDTGISSRHPDLHVTRAFNTIAGGTTADQNGHGTHVSGTIAALNNSFGLVGAASRIRLFNVKAFNKDGSAFTSDIIQAIDWCIRNRMKVINMSFGMSDESESLTEIIRRAYRRGIVMVASAGNSGEQSETIDFPARLPEVIAVAATTPSNTIADFSSRGPGISVAAPGQDICSTFPVKTYTIMDGTSMAAPHVSGAAALILARNRKLRPGRVKQILEQTAVKLPGFDENAQGAGLIKL